MIRNKLLAVSALAILLACFVLSSVSASIWEPEYETYRLGAAGKSGSYSSVETYEKVVVENEDRYSSEKQTTIKRTETETYIPDRSESKRYYRSDRYDRYDDDDDYRYRYLDSYGRGRDYIVKDEVRYGNVYIKYDDHYLPSSNWRFKESYRTFDYPYENEYPGDYYYEPRYDWHRDIYNWRY